MARCLHILAGIITNIVEYPNGHPVRDDFGADIIAALTGFESVGDNLSNNLVYAQLVKQAALDALLNNNFDLIAFIRSGSSVLVSGVAVGTFLSTIANNYRSLRAQIAAAGTVGAVNAININSGWPANP